MFGVWERTVSFIKGDLFWDRLEINLKKQSGKILRKNYGKKIYIYHTGQVSGGHGRLPHAIVLFTQRHSEHFSDGFSQISPGCI